jgi:hypothetical protein
MSKYKIDRLFGRSEQMLCAIANELAEQNRLTRLKMSMETTEGLEDDQKVDTFTDEELEDKA